ncbi:hypothetical protein [Serratia marcescens]|uniref:hypothetical protein n=1 Tax=Serratia marcescens TaxID=615 RepID=UPI000F826D7C|nr:hypothetical protein [Serratia marcescens]
MLEKKRFIVAATASMFLLVANASAAGDGDHFRDYQCKNTGAPTIIYKRVYDYPEVIGMYAHDLSQYFHEIGDPDDFIFELDCTKVP